MTNQNSADHDSLILVYEVCMQLFESVLNLRRGEKVIYPVCLSYLINGNSHYFLPPSHLLYLLFAYWVFFNYNNRVSVWIQFKS